MGDRFAPGVLYCIMPNLRRAPDLLAWVVLTCAACTPVREPPPRESAPTEPAPAPPVPEPPTPTPTFVAQPIRDDHVASATVRGITPVLRTLLHEFTAADGLRVAFALVPAPPVTAANPWYGKRFDLSEAMTHLRFEITREGGPTTSLIPTRGFGRADWSVLDASFQLRIDGVGLWHGDAVLPTPWTQDARDLFATPGAYTLVLRGEIPVDGDAIAIATPPLAFTVLPDAAAQPIAALETIAGEIAMRREGLSEPPERFRSIVEDVAGNRSLRTTVETKIDRNDVRVLEIVLARDGTEVGTTAYDHFRCVGAGTPIATPRGEVAIETLEVGDAIWAWDPESGRRVTTHLEHIEALHARRLLELGALRVTAGHPVFVDGCWRAAGELVAGDALLDHAGHTRAIAAAPTALGRGGTVFELSVGWPHTYFAGGWLVHNKARYVPLGGDDAPFGGLFARRGAPAAR